MVGQGDARESPLVSFLTAIRPVRCSFPLAYRPLRAHYRSTLNMLSYCTSEEVEREIMGQCQKLGEHVIRRFRAFSTS